MIVSVAAVIFLVAGTVLGLWSAREMREQVGDQFNEQQLVIARNVTDLIEREQYGIMVAARGENAVPVPLIEVAGNKKLVPPDHSWVTSARNVGTSFGN